jgi:hypothetical protein
MDDHRKSPRALVADLRAVASRLERLAPKFPPDARPLVKDTIELLRNRADELTATDGDE